MASLTFKVGQTARYKPSAGAFRALWGKRVRVLEVLGGQKIIVQLLDEPGSPCSLRKGERYESSTYKFEVCDGLLDV